MEFSAFMEGFNATPPTSIDIDSKPVDVLTFIKHHGHLVADIDSLKESKMPKRVDGWQPSTIQLTPTTKRNGTNSTSPKPKPSPASVLGEGFRFYPPIQIL